MSPCPAQPCAGQASRCAPLQTSEISGQEQLCGASWTERQKCSSSTQSLRFSEPVRGPACRSDPRWPPRGLSASCGGPGAPLAIASRAASEQMLLSSHLCLLGLRASGSALALKSLRRQVEGSRVHSPGRAVLSPGDGCVRLPRTCQPLQEAAKCPCGSCQLRPLGGLGWRLCPFWAILLSPLPGSQKGQSPCRRSRRFSSPCGAVACLGPCGEQMEGRSAPAALHTFTWGSVVLADKSSLPTSPVHTCPGQLMSSRARRGPAQGSGLRQTGSVPHCWAPRGGWTVPRGLRSILCSSEAANVTKCQSKDQLSLF